jgi:hypothetical protein
MVIEPGEYLGEHGEQRIVESVQDGMVHFRHKMSGRPASSSEADFTAWVEAAPTEPGA